jgi:hypothetical protein
MLFDSSGIEIADYLSIDHIIHALDDLKGMHYPDSHPIIDES